MNTQTVSVQKYLAAAGILRKPTTHNLLFPTLCFLIVLCGSCSGGGGGGSSLSLFSSKNSTQTTATQTAPYIYAELDSFLPGQAPAGFQSAFVYVIDTSTGETISNASVNMALPTFLWT